MKKFLILILISGACPSLYAQYVYTIKADSVKITNNCDTAELILENHTQNVLGFLYNKGKGRTEFRRVVKLNDSTFIFGGDTLVFVGANGITASNGLTKTTASNIALGGTLQENTSLNLDSYDFNVHSTNSGRIRLAGGAGGVTNTSLVIDDHRFSFYVMDFSDATKGIDIDLENAGIRVTDLVDGVGLVYSDDYTNGVENPLWIPHIRYVRQAITDSLATRPALESGTYTPASTNISNVFASSPSDAEYTRIGNIVHVTGSVSLTLTATSGSLELTLPIASDFSSNGQAHGVAISNTGATAPALYTITTNSTSDKITISITGATAQSFSISYSYQYSIFPF
jgi:hypothetical protein